MVNTKWHGKRDKSFKGTHLEVDNTDGVGSLVIHIEVFSIRPLCILPYKVFITLVRGSAEYRLMKVKTDRDMPVRPHTWNAYNCNGSISTPRVIHQYRVL